MAAGDYCTESGSLHINEVMVTKPILPTGKQVRQNSKDLHAAHQLAEGAITFARRADALFVEVPVGSQSARAMASYGICVGILAALRAFDIPFFEVTPTEVKVTATGRRTATKQEMISWASERHPEAPWPYQTKRGVTSIVEGSAEHMADAVGAIHAGLQTSEYKQMAKLLAGIKQTA